MPAELRAQRHDRTLVLTLHQPQHGNAMTASMCAAGIEALSVAEGDDEVACVVLTGSNGDFSVGLDLNRLWRDRQAGAPALAQALDRLHEWIDVVRTFPKPVICAIEGCAAHEGLALALSCDLVLAAHDARLQLGQGRAGLPVQGGLLWQLTQRIPRPLLAPWLWLDAAIPVERWRDWGLLTQLTPAGRTLPEALSLASRLQQLDPTFLASSKELLSQADGVDPAAHRRLERAAFAKALLDPRHAVRLRDALEPKLRHGLGVHPEEGEAAGRSPLPMPRPPGRGETTR